MSENRPPHPGKAKASAEMHKRYIDSAESMLDRGLQFLLDNNYSNEPSTPGVLTADYGEAMKDAYDVAHWYLSEHPKNIHVARLAVARANIMLDGDSIYARLCKRTDANGLVFNFSLTATGVHTQAYRHELGYSSLEGGAEEARTPITVDSYTALVALRTVKRVIQEVPNNFVWIRTEPSTSELGLDHVPSMQSATPASPDLG